MTIISKSFRKALSLLGIAALAAINAPPAAAQGRSVSYCFVVQDTLSVFSSPSSTAATPDRFLRGDIAYAIANPPTVRFDGNRAFVEVAIYGGNRGWLPRLSTIDGVPLIVDLTTDQCRNPPFNAAGGGGGIVGGDNGGSLPYCYRVQMATSVFSSPNVGAATGDRFLVGDIAYATTNPPTAVVQGGRSFIEVAIYGGNRAWVPQRSANGNQAILMDLSTAQCNNPPAQAAGRR
ncbi:hypothetical protein IQ254_09915 [Nodosilinea sp. LEGE 07088]|uniref:hypothetical protein n=1 Tax=Nodosilinea sp. LEGE 07088 TaxID=2777968 RepID=UPI00187EB195|nr:hypothetical protein [Nodosilinea sp. LEGE 07088]MBE9137522.1 hypothetical protein [Nodosilinea sp. LEGE 07088]